MKILYLYQYFTTPKGSYGTRVYEFTKKWVEMGHDVTVISAVYYKSDIRVKKFIETIYFEGIKVKVINIKISNKQSFLRRVLTFIIYTIFSTYYSLSIKSDVIVSSSGPITVGIPALISKFLINKQYIFEVRDLWPEAPEMLGVLKNKILISLSYKFEELCYKYSSLIVVLSDGMKKNISQRFPEKTICTITNSANIDLFNRKKKKLDCNQLLGKKYAIYTGNIGMVNNSELLYRTSLLLEKFNKDIYIVLVGDGQLRDFIKSKSKNIENLIVLDPLPKIELINIIKNAFISIIPLDNIPILSTSSPNKLFESMAAGIPVIQTTEGWISELLYENNCGITVSPDDEMELFENLIFLSENKKLRLKMGQNAKNYAIKYFDKNYLAKKMINNIEKSLIS